MDKKSLLTDSTRPRKAWKGYSFDELRYRRALTEIKYELKKEEMLEETSGMLEKAKMPFSGKSGRIMGKVMGALDYFDYAFIAYKIGSKFMKLRRRLRSR